MKIGKKTKPEKRVILAVRLPASLVADLKALAESEGRTTSELVRIAIEKLDGMPHA